ncbi:type II toxin-antitoxin system PemK/MazF family toxin [Neomoorella thermoacetica]|uniref:type II toxin-antitoxin system PemK/MazF family toxin n=1 Tax=Neomoorella thermoacetica TaxID=1525 RepID=UPI0009BEEFCC
MNGVQRGRLKGSRYGMKQDPKGHEQEGVRPAVVVGVPQGAGGIPKASTVLIDQVRAVDVRRVKAYLGTLDETTFEPIRASLLKIFQKEISSDCTPS